MKNTVRRHLFYVVRCGVVRCGVGERREEACGEWD